MCVILVKVYKTYSNTFKSEIYSLIFKSHSLIFEVIVFNRRISNVLLWLIKQKIFNEKTEILERKWECSQSVLVISSLKYVWMIFSICLYVIVIYFVR